MKTRSGHLFKRGKYWHVQWRVNGKLFMRSTKQTSRDKAETERAKIMAPFLAQDEADVLQNVAGRIARREAEIVKYDEDKTPPLTIAKAWPAYIGAGNRNDISDSTLTIYQYYWNAFTRWLNKNHPAVTELRQVSFKVAEAYKASMANKTGRTFNAHRAFMRSFFGVLQDKARAESNPWQELKRRTENSKGRRALTTDELMTVCRSADGELRLMLACGLYLGARMGDACRMDWGNFDMGKRLVTYTPHKTANKKPNAMVIPMHNDLFVILNETASRKRTGPLTPELAMLYNDKGPYAVSAIVQKHFTDNGITTTEEGKGVRRHVSAGFHSLRHSAVTIMRHAGAAQATSEAVVGHSSAEVHALYTHQDEAALSRAVASLPSVLGTETEPAEKSDVNMVDTETIKKLVKKLNARNLKNVKAELLALLN